MHDHILVPVALDHEGHAVRKLDAARRLLNPGGRITLATVLEDVPAFVSEFIDLKPVNHLSAKVKARLDALADGDANVTTLVLQGKAGVRLPEWGKENGVDLIIVGSHSPGGSGYLLGSTAARIARRAHCSVYIFRED